MATNVVMPKWGMSMRQGLVGSWLRKEGDSVDVGDQIVEIESDKAINVVEAPASGVLARILVPEGETVPIATVIAVIAEPGEELSETLIAKTPAEPTSSVEPSVVSSTGKPAAARPRSPSGRVSASPAARRLARGHNVDLTNLSGSGSEGMIVEKDVKAVIDTGPALQTVPTTNAAFYSQGHRLDGTLYFPAAPQTDRPLPGVVFCLGYTYVKDMLVPEMARRLCSQGIVCLAFDYRGFGKSEGMERRVIPAEQVADVRAAVSFLAERPEVDPGRIGLVGISLGGAHALYVAGIDQRIRAVAAIAPIGDAQRWLRGSRPYWAWRQLLTRIEADRTARMLGQKGERVDAWDIVGPDPASRAFLDDLLRDFPFLKCELSLETAEALLEYAPEAVVSRIAPRPVLLVHGEEDLLVPPEESRSLFAAAGEPRKLMILPGMSHFDWATPTDKRFDLVMNTVGDWLGVHIQVAPGGRGAGQATD